MRLAPIFGPRSKGGLPSVGWHLDLAVSGALSSRGAPIFGPRPKGGLPSVVWRPPEPQVPKDDGPEEASKPKPCRAENSLGKFGRSLGKVQPTQKQPPRPVHFGIFGFEAILFNIYVFCILPAKILRNYLETLGRQAKCMYTTKGLIFASKNSELAAYFK